MKQRIAEYEFLTNGGEMGALIAKKDWSGHILGPVDSWPSSLKSALGICLYSKFPMGIYWGEEMCVLYNDAWNILTGNKHPEAFGKPAREIWSENWELIEPALRNVITTGEASLRKKELLPMKRYGFTEESYFDYTFSPIFKENQQIVGIFNVTNEVTDQILSQRRNQNLRRLSEKSITAESPEAACILLANTLTEAPEDIPFGLFYLLNHNTKTLRLAASTSLDENASIAVSTIDLSADDSVMPFNKVIKLKKEKVIEDLGKSFELPGGIWDEPSSKAALIPIIRPSTKELYGVFVGGISPRLPYDQEYAYYFKQISELAAFSIGNAIDLQQKLLLESRERKAQEQLQTALSTGAVGTWLWNIPENRVIADKNSAYRFGVDYDDAKDGLPSSVFTECIHPDDRHWVIDEINRAVKITKVFKAEYRMISRDGEVKWVIARGQVEDDANGAPIRFPGVLVDITERKEVEHELASTERIFKALFESSIIGVAVATLDGKVHEANEMFLNMFGYTKKDLAKGFYSHMITPTKSKGMTSIIYEMLRKEGEVDPTEKEYLRKDGTTIPVLVGAVMIPGATDRFIMFMLDISEQKKLIAVNKAKDEFISIASHQLRTPATGVKQYLGMLLEGYAGTLTVEQNKMINTAYLSNERQLLIVNDLLRVAQADANEIKLRLKNTDLSKLLQDVIAEQEKRFEASKQNILFINTCRNAFAKLDPLHIRMVFENVIDNAHKYTPENKTITIHLSRERKKLIVSVKDEGVGIYKKDMSKLFKKFSRIDNPLSTSAGGTGLGLYWVSKIIDLHKGSIEVSSRYHHGTEFTITLPTGVI